jgi:hypothetical protein
MPTKNRTPSVDEWAKRGIPSHQPVRCSTCQHPKLVAAAARFQKLRDDGLDASWSRFFTHFVRKELDVKGLSYDTFMNHVRHCLHKRPRA